MRNTVVLLATLVSASACDRTQPPSEPRAPASAHPTATGSATPTASALPSASVAASPPGPPELVVAAEDAGSVNATTITNAMLLGGSLKQGEDQAVTAGGVITRPAPDGSAIEDTGDSDDFGRWPDDLWVIQSYLSWATSPENSAGSRIYALTEGRWKKMLDDGTHRFLDVWEAPRGCWLGLSSNAWLTGSSTKELKRVALKCAPKPPPLTISRKDTSLVGARGLSDGSVVAIEMSSEWLFNPGPSQAPGRLVIFDTKGKERALALPVPTLAAQAKLYDIGTRVLLLADGAFGVFTTLTNRQSPRPDRVTEPYFAKCDAAACAPLALPAVKDVLAIETAEDGALLLAGRESADVWSLWSLAPKASTWTRLGAAPKTWSAVKVAALYGSSADDVWAAVETTAKPARSALLHRAR